MVDKKIKNKESITGSIKIPLRGLIVFLFLIWVSLNTSNADDLKRYNNENGVVLEQKQNVTIEIENDGNLSIIADIYEETLHLKESAKFFSEQSINYSNSFSEISDIDAYSLIPNDKNKYKKYKVTDFKTTDARSDGVFFDDQKQITFYYPAMQAGAKTVLEYKKTYKEPRLWGYYVFASYFPVVHSEFTVTMPKAVKLNFKIFGIDENRVRFTKEEKGGDVIYQWKCDNLDKISVSSGSGSILHTAPHIIVYVDSYLYDGEKKMVLSGVSDLHAWYQHFVQMVESGEKDNKELDGIVSGLINGRQNELQKVEAIYKWVQQNIKYIAIEDGLGGFMPRDANKVFTRRYGDCKDMSNLLHRMLEVAGIPSSLTWIGTSAIPYTHREVPTPMADNHMICTYVNNGRYYFLDATDQYNELGMPSFHIQGREALVNTGKDKEDYELIKVPVVPFEKNKTEDSVTVQLNNGLISGKGFAIYSGYARIPVADNLLNLDEKDKQDFLTSMLSKGNNKFFIQNIDTKNTLNSAQNLEIDYDFKIEDYILKTNNDLIFNPHLNKSLARSLVDTTTNKEDIHYPYKNLTRNVVTVEIPDGYKIQYIPKNQSFKKDNFGFDLEYTSLGNHFQLTQNIYVNALKLSKDQFGDWNEMVKELLQAYKESVVFTKE